MEWNRMVSNGMERNGKRMNGMGSRRVHRFFFAPPWTIFAPPPLALKMLLFYIKSTTCPRPMWPIVVPIQGLYIIMYLSSVLLFEVLSSLLRLLPFVVHCRPHSRSTYYNVSLCSLYSSVLLSEFLSNLLNTIISL